jgi:hypothetical protein
VGNTIGPGRREAAGRRSIRPLTTGRVVYEMPVVVTRQERQFEPSMRRVLGAHKKPKAESADRESPNRGVIAAPMADEPGEDEGDQPDATNPHKVMPHRLFTILREALVGLSRKPGFTKGNEPRSWAGLLGLISVQRALIRGTIRLLL